MKKLATALVAGAMALVLVACGAAGGGVGGNRDSVIVVGAGTPQSGQFSPLYYSAVVDSWTVNLVFDQLLNYDVNNEVVPVLATDLPEISEDGLTYTFHLRDDVTFSNGNPFTAEDVEFTLSILADPSYTGRYLSLVQYVEGFEAMRAGDADTLSGIEVVDEHTISITFTEELASNRDVGFFGIMNKADFPDYTVGDTSIFQDRDGSPVGTGPYTLVSWAEDTGSIHQKNPNFWGERSETSPETIIIRPVSSLLILEELRAGNVDIWTGEFTASNMDGILGDESLAHYHYVDYSRPGFGYFGFNASHGSTADVAVRQALTYAFNRQEFNDLFFATEVMEDVGVYIPQTYANPASTVGDIVRGETTIPGLNQYEFDLDRANQILDEAGWVRGADGIREKDGERLVIRLISSPDNEVLSTLVPIWNSDWTEVGADVQIATQEFQALLAMVQDADQADQWSAFFLATQFVGDSNDTLWTTFHSSEAHSNNLSAISDPALDALLDQAIRETDPDAQRELWEQVAVMTNDLAALIPIYANTMHDFYDSNKIEGFQTNTLFQWPLAIPRISVK